MCVTGCVTGCVTRGVCDGVRVTGGEETGSITEFGVGGSLVQV